MRNAILIHGWNTKKEYYDPTRPTASNDHWFPWLTKQLVLKDINAISIEMPNGYYPEYSVWKHELERYDISEQTILVGHSCGGGFLVRWLGETDAKVGKVILVAPWLGIDTGDEPFDKTFFDFEIDPGIAKKTAGLTILISSDDDKSVVDSVEILRDKLTGVKFTDFKDKGHFTLGSLGASEFPELLKGANGMSDLIKLQDRAMEIRRRYTELEKKRDGTTRNAVKMANGFKKDVQDLIEILSAKELDQRKLNHELADCLWSVLVIARKMDVDIERAFWTAMLDLDNRLDGELK